MAICNVTNQTVVSGHYVSFQTKGGELKRYYALESPLDQKGVVPTHAATLDAVAADIASIGEPGELRWNPPTTIHGTGGAQIMPLAPVVIRIVGGDVEDVKSQIRSGGETPVRRFVVVDDQKVLVEIKQKLYPPLEGV